ncbi:hypothetical protein GE061_015371 [Apolygus lucorum]|uniref:Uncharacterized protein n=1 Tax=Apolygus lucorum TaxID=248454 RepID=A0A6A4JL56_APOLU|nr:hypothetical protein GE061_015371 [Apolygus lucorum]
MSSSADSLNDIPGKVDPEFGVFRWTIDKFSAQEQGRVDSPSFNFGERAWKLSIWSQGRGEGNIGYVSLFLAPADFIPASSDNVVSVRVSFSIINVFNEDTHKNSAEGSWVFEDTSLVGCSRLVPLCELVEKGLLVDDTLKIRCEMKVHNGTLPELEEHPVQDDDVYGPFKRDYDLVVNVQNQQFGVHKVFLSVNSEVFATMFHNKMKDSSSDEVTIDDIKPTVFQEFLRFLYLKRVNKLTLGEYQQLIACADKYSMSELKDICSKAIRGDISSNNAVDLLIFAEKYSSPVLKADVMKFLSSVQ